MCNLLIHTDSTFTENMQCMYVYINKLQTVSYHWDMLYSFTTCHQEMAHLLRYNGTSTVQPPDGKVGMFWAKQFSTVPHQQPWYWILKIPYIWKFETYIGNDSESITYEGHRSNAKFIASENLTFLCLVVGMEGICCHKWHHVLIVLVHTDFCPSNEQPEQHILAHKQ